MGERIIQAGHTAIGVIGGITQHNDRATDRIRGISQCFSDHGFPIPEDLIIETPYQPEESATALDELLTRNPDLTVIFVAMMFLQLVLYIARKIEVSMFLGNSQSPGLTTLRWRKFFSLN